MPAAPPIVAPASIPSGPPGMPTFAPARDPAMPPGRSTLALKYSKISNSCSFSLSPGKSTTGSTSKSEMSARPRLIALSLTSDCVAPAGTSVIKFPFGNLIEINSSSFINYYPLRRSAHDPSLWFFVLLERSRLDFCFSL